MLGFVAHTCNPTAGEMELSTHETFCSVVLMGQEAPGSVPQENKVERVEDDPDIEHCPLCSHTCTQTNT